MNIINPNISKIILFIFIVPIFPIVQGQWLNISLLNDNYNSIYRILYYLSGYSFPIILVFYSLNNFTDFKLSDYGKFNSKGFSRISYIIFSILLLISILITKYYIYLFSIIKNETFYFFTFDNYQLIFVLIFSVLLLIRKTKKIVKSIYLISYLIIFSIYWTISSFKINIPFLRDEYVSNFLDNNINFNFINILYLFLLEILFYLWSYISHNNNLSDWHIPIPKKYNLDPLVNIFIFYFGVIVYFYIFRNI